MVLELTSPTLSSDLLSKLKKASEKEITKNLAKAQIKPVVNFLKSFLNENKLSTAYEDIIKVNT